MSLEDAINRVELDGVGAARPADEAARYHRLYLSERARVEQLAYLLDGQRQKADELGQRAELAEAQARGAIIQLQAAYDQLGGMRARLRGLQAAHMSQARALADALAEKAAAQHLALAFLALAILGWVAASYLLILLLRAG